MPVCKMNEQEFIKIFALNFFIATEFQNLLSTTKASSLMMRRLLTSPHCSCTSQSLIHSPLVVGAGAGAVHPAVLLVSVLSHPLSAVVEGGLDAAHTAQGVHCRLGRAEARVVT